MTEGIASSSPEQQSTGYQPPEPIQPSPMFVWPPQPVAALKWIFGFPGYLLPWLALFIGISTITWQFLTPYPASMNTFSVDWIGYLFIRNLAILVAVMSLWHVRLYVLKAQRTDYKYNKKWLGVDDSTFLFRNQLWDNVFWNICSAVPIWTAYEALTFWMHANGYASTVSWDRHPLYIVVLLLLTPLWADLHFYTTHRLIHWAPLYKSIHYLHHKNTNPGPWSGLAMHPVEHLIYFSGVILFWLIPASPLNGLFYLQYLALSAPNDHQGFDRLVLGKKKIMFNADHYMHYLHHKYFMVNYSVNLMPLDKWLGTLHDGTVRGMELMKKRRQARGTAAIGGIQSHE